MTSATGIESLVMRRIYRVHTLRRVGGGALALAVFALALWGIGREVWVAQVFANAPREGFATMARFYIAAFENTRVTVQALCIAAFASLLWAFRDLFRAVSLSISVKA